ncbi:Antilisterial bacteriocin subtilosin biosynthesis protein AlbA [Anaerohalosphaera lusitana]|uniref:Antilisterial bacteriocin subtilosin biosynthesis protein AlbA n=1 Tax=Anaerohalosphaera lusitana TaxID=1936003 RepID=A0A1U9NJ22_9BACT|nr:radical SAM protein [Anaerohalosphaera lusitana]AQT67738.1 Antilisterial bacteriocin subtilosin biosynthesis protein AlbA [Anaerohalosphaera lusitana]
MMPSNGKNKRTLRLLFWESTIKCNLTCSHCRRVEGDEQVGTDMTTGQAKSLIDQLAELGKSQDFMPILVFSGGEPLCRDDVFELAGYAGDQGLRTALATNGTMIDAETAARIEDAGFARVSISLDGATEQVHNKLRQEPGCFDAALNGMAELQKANVPFQVNMTMTRHNAHQLDDIFNLAKNMRAQAVHLFMMVPVGCGEQFNQADMLDADEYEQMMKRIAATERSGNIEVKVTCGPHYERVKRQTQHQSARSRHPSKGCLAGSGVIFIGHQGDVFPCGYLPVNCGSVLRQPLADIWHGSEDLARMRDANRLTGKCGICEFKRLCGGCRARAYAATGDYMSEEPFCAYVPKNLK